MPQSNRPSSPPSPRQIDRLLDVMKRLRDPQSGCPWDVEQTPTTIAPFAIEEAYEVMDAIARDDREAIPDELGDLLLQVVFQAQMAQEAGHFDFETVAGLIADKLVRRHPHVFGDAALDDDSWEREKDAERQRKAEYGALAGVALPLPALMRAAKLSRRAARVGFDWDDPTGILDKVHEEIDELKAELGGDRDRIEDELGDVLFTVASLARKLDIDPEAALRRSNAKFTRRFEAMEAMLARRGQTMAKQDLPTMEALWQEAKTLPGMK
ncbi:nucleoside triphosphate pyrophosphohydrolase [Gluconobacter kondonii]|uniref:nucleoside triphosphate pyrophosphohydrolase n=1 Tax=Gluconobacter kondonii TaxID=941463 RepID=UPI001B8B9929|nr:nucleoside triphosphate pyrophosphohydrolase [Gluconobacter kondonii]MBS1066517.1 nucleoside triphosphate pyrophosphohydrolase [Gluconobacter kondonii]MBS1081552.1 nucleoside triphosphate pyrophosphohydrolase [Gluconobacter kondonii]MBS1084197.1 nucleoside triphosphate pyrophosphohydrolase [Gluconobacter kondonii]